MTDTVNSNDFVAELRDHLLLDSWQLEELRRLADAGCQDPNALASEARQRGWLTDFQVSELLHGNAARLSIGPYRLLQPLGEGAMGQVFKARHRRLQRVVALKIIRAEKLEGELLHRFQREARLAAQLNHPHIVTLYDADEDGKLPFIAMEYVDGIDLARLLRERGRPLPVLVACDFIRQAATGLQHAFERGVVHRDIKPSNLLVSGYREPLADSARDPCLLARDEAAHPWGMVKILDMGLARLHESEAGASAALTRVGAVIGTPDFIAPEQARDASKADIRADLYSLGCTFYFLTTGQPPFPDGSVIEKLLKHQLDQPRPVEELRPDLPPAVACIIRRLMAKQPDKRFQTPQELIDELRALASMRRVAEDAPGPDELAGSTAMLNVAPARSTTAEVKTQQLAIKAPPRPLEDTRTGDVAGSPRLDPGLSDSEQQSANADECPHRIASLHGHVGWVSSLCFAPDRNRLASGGVDGQVCVWGFSSKLPRQVQLGRVHAGDVRAMAFAPDSITLATASGAFDGQVWLWNVSGENPRKVACFQKHEAPIQAAAFCPSGKLLATGGFDKVVYLWDAIGLDGTPRYVLKGEADVITAIAFSPDGKRVATGDQSGQIHLWHMGMIWASEKVILAGHAGAVRDLAFSRDGRYLASSSQDESIRLWDLRDNTCRTLQITPEVARRVMFPADGQTLAAVSLRGQVLLWNVASNEVVRHWHLGDCFDFTHDGRYLAVGKSEGTTDVYRLYPRGVAQKS